MLVNITYRIVTAEDAETVTFQLKSGQEFPLNRLFMPVVAEDQKIVFHIKVDVETLLRVDVGPVSLNGLKIEDDPVVLRPGDVLRLNGHSIEIHDCPTPKKDHGDSTQFIDSSMIAGSTKPSISRKLPIIAALAAAFCFSSMFATAPITVNSENAGAGRKPSSTDPVVVEKEVVVQVPVPTPVPVVVAEPEQAKVNKEIFLAITNNDFAQVKSLIDGGVSADFVLDEKGRTPLLAAANLGRLKIIQYLVGRKVNLEASDFEGKTALMLAISGNNLETVRYLLGVGVDLDKKNEDGQNALALAKKVGNGKILSSLQHTKKHAHSASN